MDKIGHIGIIDIGIGNIASIQRIIAKAQGKTQLITRPEQLADFQKVILPGVGHFDEAMKTLNRLGFTQALIDYAHQDRTIMGICLGMQLLCRGSEEGSEPGLGLIDADVKAFRFPEGKTLNVPHMGWNIVYPAKANPLIPPTDAELRFYFVHSFQVVPDQQDIVIGTTNYGGDFCAAFQKNHIFGVQFLPEKSHQFGLALISRFVER